MKKRYESISVKDGSPSPSKLQVKVSKSAIGPTKKLMKEYYRSIESMTNGDATTKKHNKALNRQSTAKYGNRLFKNAKNSSDSAAVSKKNLLLLK